MVRRVVLVLLLLLAAWPSPVPAETVDDVVRGLEGAYGGMQDLRGEFAQTAFNKSLNQSIPARGAVYMKRGGKLRWEYSEPKIGRAHV